MLARLTANPLMAGVRRQGTHVTAHLGTYILQWRYQESASGHHGSPLELIDSITAHKARVMYFYETLRSADYKWVALVRWVGRYQS